MIVEKYMVEHERRMNDYCEGCPHFYPETIESMNAGIEKNGTKHILEACLNRQICGRLYEKMKGEHIE